MSSINTSFVGGTTPQRSNVQETTEHTGVSNGVPVKGCDANPVIGIGVTKSADVSTASPQQALHALWIALNKPTVCPEYKDASHLEGQVSTLLSSSGLTLDGLKKALMEMPERNKWVSDFMKNPSVDIYLNSGGPISIGRYKAVADKFAKVIAKSVLASPQSPAGRRVEKSVTPEKESIQKDTTVTVEAGKQENDNPVKKTQEAISKVASVVVEEKECKSDVGSTTEVTESKKNNAEPSVEENTTSTLQSSLESLWAELNKSNAGLSHPTATSADDALYIIDDLLYDSDMTMGQLKSAIDVLAISQPWARACQTDSVLVGYLQSSSGRVSDIACTLAEIILSYMNGKPAEKAQKQKATPTAQASANKTSTNTAATDAFKPEAKQKAPFTQDHQSGFSSDKYTRKESTRFAQPDRSASRSSRSSSFRSDDSGIFNDSAFYSEAGRASSRHFGFEGFNSFGGETDRSGSRSSSRFSSEGAQGSRPDSATDSGFFEARKRNRGSHTAHNTTTGKQRAFGVKQTKNQALNAIFTQLGNGKVEGLEDAMAVLGLTVETASVSEAKSAYKKLFRLYHPDKLINFKGVNVDGLDGAARKAEINEQKQQGEEYAKLLKPALEMITELLS